MSSGVSAPEVTVGEAENVEGCYVCVFVLLESRHIVGRGSQGWHWRNAGEPVEPESFKPGHANEFDLYPHSSRLLGSSQSAEIVCCFGNAAQFGLRFCLHKHKLNSSCIVVHY